MHESRFQLATGDRNVGTIYLPDEQSAPMPALVVCFGGQSHRQPYPFTAELCARLTAAGAALVSFDFYAWGETPGDSRDATYGRWAANLADVCAWLRTQEWADGDRIGALGISAGSTAVLRCAIDTSQLALGISVATFLGHYVSMPGGPAKRFVDHLDALIEGGTIDDLFGFPCDLAFFKDAIGGAPIYRLHTITCPIFFLQGVILLGLWPRKLLDPWPLAPTVSRDGIAVLGSESYTCRPPTHADAGSLPWDRAALTSRKVDKGFTVTL